MGDAWSLEQRLGLSESFASGSLAMLRPEKVETCLLNLVIKY